MVAALAAAAACGPVLHEREGAVIVSGPGGDVAAHVLEAARLSAMGRRVQVGDCDSACAAFLGVPGACVQPGRRVRFHGVYGSPEEVARGEALMRMALPPEMARWWDAGPRHLPITRFEVLTGEEVSARFGVPLCEERD